jgi:hypothetical protein
MDEFKIEYAILSLKNIAIKDKYYLLQIKLAFFVYKNGGLELY